MVHDLVRWSRRLDDLDTPLTTDQWERLRIDLREQCANHPKTDPLYGVATECGHTITLDSYGEPLEDDLHVWSDDIDDLICLGKVLEHACLCQDGYCSQIASAREAHDALWNDVSYEHRRRLRAAHLQPAVIDAWLTTGLSLDTAEELAHGCPNESQYRQRVADALAAATERTTP